MRYHVKIKAVDSIQPADPRQALERMERAILPSLDSLSKWEKEGKIRGGGIYAGGREGAFVIEAANHDELGEWLGKLPFWPYVETRVTPLESFETRFERDRKVVEEIKKTL
jgi:muconolactone delta-isomerase